MLDFRAIVEGLDVGVIVQDRRAAIVFANASARQLLGLGEGELLGKTSFDPMWDCIEPNGAPMPPDRRPLARTLASKQGVRNVVMGIARPDGSRAWLAVTTDPVLDATGEIDHVRVTLRDISEERHARVQAERALEESERLYHSVLRAMSEGVVLHDADGTIRFANPAAERVLGLSIEQLTGRSPLDPRWRLVVDDDRPFDPEKIPSEITRATGRPCNQVPVGVHRGNGERAWLSVSTDPVAIDPATGRPSAVVATFADVTREQLARRELARSQAHFKRVTDAFPGVLYEFRSRGGRYDFPFLSGRAEHFFGVPDEVAMADADAVLARIHPDESEAFRRSIEVSERTMQPWSAEFRMATSDCGWRWCRALSVPEQRDGAVTWAGVVLDVTEERRLAERLRHQQRVDALGGLVAGVAHNFNNMLAAIQPNLELAIEVTGGEVREMLEDARQASTSATELVRQLMRLTRREPEGAVERVDVEAVVHEVVALLHRTFDRSIALVVDLPRQPIAVRGRASDLQQVLLNLCINARDALEGRPDPRLAIRVTVEERVGGGSAHNVVVRVQDNGVGMDEATRRRLGEPFFTTKPPGRGTGLGVASVFGTVREMNGLVDIDTAPGAGTTFTLRLPADEGAPGRAPDGPRGRTRLDGRRILVVDDEALVRHALVRQLEHLGTQVSEAANGPAALEGFRPGAYDLVILDLNMPAMTGGQVLAELRRRAPGQRVVVLSGFVTDPAALGAADAILTKPVGREQLVATIEQVLALDRR